MSDTRDESAGVVARRAGVVALWVCLGVLFASGFTSARAGGGVEELPALVLARVAGLRPAPLAPAPVPLRRDDVPAEHAWSDTGCMGCHEGVEEMHPWEPLSCVDCHGGNGLSASIDEAHVRPEIGWPKDERVMHRGFDLPYSRFRNPSDLRVIDQTCASCHPAESANVPRSLHGTTAGHLNDGLYENGVNPTRQAVYGIFTETDERAELPEHALPKLSALSRMIVPSDPKDIGDHFTDLPRKACMQCHPWSQGVGIRGRLGLDGLYRGSGCSSCHTSYGSEGLSRSRDPTVDKFSPGHPIKHEFTRAPPTSTCVSCHVGDASIGNGFRGMAQLYPNMPAGPEVPNTTDKLIAEQFFLKDPKLTPPDIHHAKGMHCIDCHTGNDVMGDGNIYGAMEHAVEIECSSCHGTFSEVSSLTTSRGRPIENMRRNGDVFIMTSKVTGRAHLVRQVKHVLDPNHDHYNEKAARAMTSDHVDLECYACHSGWNTNFFGFHFDRNLQFTQLDTLDGDKLAGNTTTQERVFATLRQYVLGRNSEGKIAPYMVGFSSMGTVHGPDGEIVIDQGLPETAEGKSGMSMIHHQTHTTQPAARSCVECHRSAATWGLGTGGDATGSFSLARQLLVTAGERGLDILMLDREAPGASTYLSRLPLGGARKVILDADIVTGYASTAFVAQEGAGVAVVDLRNPAFPSVRSFIAAGDVRDVLLAGTLLYIANGLNGVRVVDVSDRDQPLLLADLETADARGLDMDWPSLFVADGPAGLLIVDVGEPAVPQVVGQSTVTRDARLPDDATAVSVYFQYGRPNGPRERSAARRFAAVANGSAGFSLLDVTEPLKIERISGVSERYGGGSRSVDVVVNSRFELGDTTGARPTVERDVASLLSRDAEGASTLIVLDLTEPEKLSILGRTEREETEPGGLAMMKTFAPPNLQTRLLLALEDGLHGVEVTDSTKPTFLFNLPVLAPISDVAVEAFAFDRMVDESGRQLKDISHEVSRFATPTEIERVLSVPAERLGLLNDGSRRRALYADAYASATLTGGDPKLGISLHRLSDDEHRERLEREVGAFPLASSDELARVIRQEMPGKYDGNRDRTMTTGELERMFFGILDANGDGELDPLEWPRHPDPDPSALDRNDDGIVSNPEMRLSKSVYRRFDSDKSGKVEEREWPFEIPEVPLPGLFYISREGLMDVITQLGWKRRHEELYIAIAGNLLVAPRDIPQERFDTIFDRARDGVLVDVRGDALLGTFIQRWDVDQDGEVEPYEFEPFERIAPRCDLNKDGVIDENDRP